MYDDDKLILVDCDGVLLNWEFAFKIFMKKKGHTIVNPDPFCYNVQSLYDLTKDQKMGYVFEFNNSAAMGYLPPLRDAVQYIQKLHREHGYMFHVITSMSDDPYAQELRKMNLQKIFGNEMWHGFTFLPCGADKDEVLKEWKDTGYYWVEDKLENAVEGTRNGLESILIEHGHNMIRSNTERDDPIWKEGSNIPRFAKWKDVYNHIV
jgi:hypothetical protein